MRSATTLPRQPHSATGSTCLEGCTAHAMTHAQRAAHMLQMLSVHASQHTVARQPCMMSEATYGRTSWCTTDVCVTLMCSSNREQANVPSPTHLHVITDCTHEYVVKLTVGRRRLECGYGGTPTLITATSAPFCIITTLLAACHDYPAAPASAAEAHLAFQHTVQPTHATMMPTLTPNVSPGARRPCHAACQSATPTLTAW